MGVQQNTQMRVLYAVNESYCIDASTQKGTVLAIVECSSYGSPPSFGLANNPTDSSGQYMYTFHTSTYTNPKDGAHVELIYLTLNSSFVDIQGLTTIEISLSCNWDAGSWCLCDNGYVGCFWISPSAWCQCGLYSTITFKLCTAWPELTRPYFLNVPQQKAVQIPIDSPNDHYALFNTYEVVSQMYTIYDQQCIAGSLCMCLYVYVHVLARNCIIHQ